MQTDEQRALIEYREAISAWKNKPRRSVSNPSLLIPFLGAREAIKSVLVVGLVGLGGHTLKSFRECSRYLVHSCAIDTNAKDLANTVATYRLLLGKDQLGGLGTGIDPLISAKLAEELLLEFEQFLELHQYKMVLIVAGAGGGTGSGALPVLSRYLKSKDIPSYCYLTLPLNFEGKKKNRIAHTMLTELYDSKQAVFTADLQETLNETPHIGFKDALDCGLFRIQKHIEAVLEIYHTNQEAFPVNS